VIDSRHVKEKQVTAVSQPTNFANALKKCISLLQKKNDLGNQGVCGSY
jgi:hypothetical protein